jgi:hypothetical protein
LANMVLAVCREVDGQNKDKVIPAIHGTDFCVLSISIKPSASLTFKTGWRATEEQANSWKTQALTSRPLVGISSKASVQYRDP